MKRSATDSEDNAKKSKGDVSSENNNDKGTNLNDEAQSNATTNAGNEQEGRNDPPIDVDALLAKEFEFDIPTMKRDVAILKNSIFEEGLLSQERFQQLEELENEKYKKSYIHKFYDVYFERAFKLYAEVDVLLTNLHSLNDFSDTKTVVEGYIKQLKDITEPVGAVKVLNEIDNMIQSFKQGDFDGVKSAFEKVEEENEKLRKKIDPYFKLVFRIDFKESIPMEEQRELGVGWQWTFIMSNSAAAIPDSSSSEYYSSSSEESSSSSEESSLTSEGGSSEIEEISEIDVLPVTK